MGTMSMTLRTATFLVTLAFSAAAIAAPKGNVAAGKKAFEATVNSKGETKAACTSCHGKGANQPLEGIPKLAGQYPEYLAKALNEYRSGKRKNAIMASQEVDITDADVANLSAYLGSLKGDIHDLSGHAR